MFLPLHRLPLLNRWPRTLRIFCPTLSKTAQSWVLGRLKMSREEKIRLRLACTTVNTHAILDTQAVKFPVSVLDNRDWIATPDAMALARQLANTVVTQALSAEPDCLSLAGGTIDLVPALTFVLTYQIIRQELPAYHALASQAPRYLKQPHTVLDSALNMAQIQTVLSHFGVTPKLRRWQSASSITPERLRGWTHTWQDNFGSSSNPEFYGPESSSEETPVHLNPLEPLTSGPLVFVGNDRYLAHLDPVVSTWASTQPIRVVLYGECDQLPDEVMTRWSQTSSVQVFRLDDSRVSPLTQSLCDMVETLARLHDMPTKGPATGALLSTARLMQGVGGTLLKLDSLLHLLNPSTVIGCFEVSSLGPLLSQLKTRYGFTLINVQHGNKMPSHTLDLMVFDTFNVWNAESEKLIRADGYPADAPTMITGNPLIETLSQQIDTSPPSESYHDLLDWKGESRLIVAYTQYAKGLSNSQQKQRFIQTLLRYLEGRPDLKLVIKAHPSEDVSDIRELLEGHPCQTRVRHYTYGELPLWESYKAADLATSVFSAVLYEAHMLGLPVVALDFDGIINTYHLGLKELIPIATSEDEAQRMLNVLITT